MKKGLILAALAAFFLTGAMVPGTSAVAADLGIYIAPKFVYSYAVMDMKGSLDVNDPFGWSTSQSRSKDRHDDAFGGALAIGYNFNTRFGVPVRAELEYAIHSEIEGKVSGSHQDATYGETFFVSAKQRLDVQTLFLNAYYDFDTGTAFSPYVGGGIGLAFIEADAKMHMAYFSAVSEGHSRTTGTNYATNFAWNLGAGVGWRIIDPLTLDLGYRFTWLGDTKTNYVGQEGTVIALYYDARVKTRDLYMHQVMLGLRYEF